MKCNSCGNDIAPNSVSCPVCGAQISNTSVLPATPTQAVLPSDQNVDNVITTNIPVVVPNEVDEKVQMGHVELSTTPDPVTPSQVITEVSETDTLNITSGEKENINALIQNQNKETKVKKKISKKTIIKLILVFVIIGIIGGVGYFFYNNIFGTGTKRVNTSLNKILSYISTKGSKDSIYRTGNIDVDLELESNDKKLNTKFNTVYGLDIKNNKVYGTFSFDKLSVDDKELSDLSLLKESTTYLYDNNIYVNIPNVYDKYVLVEKLENISSSIGTVDYETFIPKTKVYFTNALKTLPSKQSIGKLTIDGKTKNVNVTTISLNPGTMKKFYTTLSTMISTDDKYISEYAKFKNINENAALMEIQDLPNKDVSNAFGNLEIYTSVLGEGLFKTTVYGFKLTTKRDGKMIVVKYMMHNARDIEVLVDNKKVIDLKYTRTIGNSNGNKKISYTVNGNIIINDETYKIKLNYVDTQDKAADFKKISIKDAIDINHIPNEDKPAVSEKVNSINILSEEFLNKINEYLKYEEIPAEGEGETNTQEVE